MENQVNNNLIRRPPPRPLPPPPPPPQKFEPEQEVEKRFSKRKIITISIIVGVGIIAIITLIILIANLVSTNPKLSTPTNLEIIETANGKTYIYVDKCPNAVKYKFEITNTDEQISTIYETEQNEFDASLIFGKPATYRVTCKYLASDQTSSSAYCEALNHTKTQKIATPTISLGNCDNHNVLFVETQNVFCENVLLSFTLIYTDGSSQNTYNVFVEKENNLSGYTRGYFNLDALFSEKNLQYKLAVKINQNVNEGEICYYTASNLSSQVTYTVE